MERTIVGSDAPRLLTPFAQAGELDKATRALDALGKEYEVVSPHPGYSVVGVASLVDDLSEARAALAAGGNEIICSGWVDYRSARIMVPAEKPLSRDSYVVMLANGPNGQ